MARQTQQLRSKQRHAMPGAEGSPIHGAYLFSVFRIDSEPRAPATGAHDHPALALGARISSRRAAFTLIELLVVIAIIAILMTVLIVAGTSATDQAKRKETRTVMQLLDMAITQFKDEAPLKRVTDYRKRYGDYPCDELEPFVKGTGIPGTDDAPDGPVVVGPPGGESDINRSGGGLIGIPNREIAAMALVINLYSQDAAATLDQIGSRYRRPPADPADFFDRNNNGALDTDDEPLIYFVDAWGTPFDYFALADPGLTAAGTDTGGQRLAASAALIAANRGKPLLISYGASGPEKRVVMGGTPGGPSPLVLDYSDNAEFDNALNHDNVYLDTSLKDRIMAVDD